MQQSQLSVGVVATLLRFATLLILGAYAVSAAAGSFPRELTLKFPDNAASALGQIDKLVVKVSCGRISSLRHVPELYDIEMEYEIPTQNVLEARPRLGSAAVGLSRWSAVIQVLSEAEDCFAVSVAVEGRTGQSRQWTGRQLGLTK